MSELAIITTLRAFGFTLLLAPDGEALRLDISHPGYAGWTASRATLREIVAEALWYAGLAIATNCADCATPRPCWCD